MLDKVKKLFILALLALVAVSYHVRFSPVDALQTSLASEILVLTIVTFVICFSRLVFSIPYLKFLVIVSVLVVVSAIVCDISFDDTRYYSEFKDLAVPLVGLLIGYSALLSRKDILFSVILFGVIMIFYSSMSQISSNIGGFVIEDTYKIPSKNAIGAMLASLVAACLPLIISKSIRVISRIVLSVLVLSSIVVLLTIRARASTMTVFFTFVLFVLLVFKNRKRGHKKTFNTILIIIAIAVVTIPLLSVIYEPIGEYIYNSLFQNVEGDVTTGRAARNVLAFDFFLEHPFLGRLGTGVELPWVHNYLLRVATDYGLIFGLPLIVLYLFFLVRIAIVFLKRDTLDYQYVGCWAVIPLCMLSFVEPLFPFAPGTAVLFSYLLLGYTLQEKSQKI